MDILGYYNKRKVGRYTQSTARSDSTVHYCRSYYYLSRILATCRSSRSSDKVCRNLHTGSVAPSSQPRKGIRYSCSLSIPLSQPASRAPCVTGYASWLAGWLAGWLAAARAPTCAQLAAATCDPSAYGLNLIIVMCASS